jgi:hypothetical protein
MSYDDFFRQAFGRGATYLKAALCSFEGCRRRRTLTYTSIACAATEALQ